MKPCKQCCSPLPIQGELKEADGSQYVLRVCENCGRAHRTTFGKKIKSSKTQSQAIDIPPLNELQYALFKVYVWQVGTVA